MINAIVLCIDLGSADDGNYIGLAHLTEHLLMSGIKCNRDCNFMAYTTYEHMVFKAYYVDDCEKQKVISNIKKIISASTIEFGMLQICKNQVLCEIDNEQKLNCKMNKICCKKIKQKENILF